MRIAKWAAIAVTVLMGLANIGLIAQSNLALKILGAVLAAAAMAPSSASPPGGRGGHARSSPSVPSTWSSR